MAVMRGPAPAAAECRLPDRACARATLARAHVDAGAGVLSGREDLPRAQDGQIVGLPAVDAQALPPAAPQRGLRVPPGEYAVLVDPLRVQPELVRGPGRSIEGRGIDIERVVRAGPVGP